MLGDIKEHTGHYLLLAFVLGAGILLFSLTNYNTQLQQLVAIGMGISYFFWGLLHHFLTDKVTAKIVLEYALVATIGVLIINSLLIGR